MCMCVFIYVCVCVCVAYLAGVPEKYGGRLNQIFRKAEKARTKCSVETRDRTASKEVIPAC